MTAVTHDLAPALTVVPAAMFIFVMVASRVWLAYFKRSAGPRLRRVIALEPRESINSRGGQLLNTVISAVAVLLLATLVMDNLWRPDGTVALILGAGGLLFAVAWLVAMPTMTSPARPPDDSGD